MKTNQILEVVKTVLLEEEISISMLNRIIEKLEIDLKLIPRIVAAQVLIGKAKKEEFITLRPTDVEKIEFDFKLDSWVIEIKVTYERYRLLNTEEVRSAMIDQRNR